jgi:hypothetical protein
LVIIENGALIFATGQCSIYLCTFHGVLEHTRQRPQLEARSGDEDTTKRTALRSTLSHDQES